MARKTKAEMEAERELAQASQAAYEAEQYPTRLMAALEAATTTLNFELTVRDGIFLVQDRNDRPVLSELWLSVTYNRNSQEDLERLEWAVKNALEERAEAERRWAVKQAALNKLSKEEKELLGLAN